MTMQIDPDKYQLTTKSQSGKTYVFDPVRKKYVQMAPEEWVRQLVLQFLIQEKNVPKALMAVEMDISLHDLSKRCDVVVFDRNGRPKLVVECKAPDVRIKQKVFDQIARYNMALRVNYLVVTNGSTSYCCVIDHQQRSYQFIEGVPDFEELVE